MNGVYFALRSGKEHRNLRFSPSQINIIEKDGDRAYVEYVRQGPVKKLSRWIKETPDETKGRETQTSPNLSGVP